MTLLNSSEFLDYLDVVINCLPEEHDRMQNFMTQSIANVLNRVDTFGVALGEFFDSLTPILQHAFPDAPIPKIQHEFRNGLKAIQEFWQDQGYYDDLGYATCWMSGYTKPQLVMFSMFTGKERSRT